MARFYGLIGYSLDSEETSPGIYENIIVEREYYGNFIRNAVNIQAQDALGEGKVNQNLILANSISIVADPYAMTHFSAMKYVKLPGANWTITQVEVVRPRLTLRLGGVYNGPTA